MKTVLIFLAITLLSNFPAFAQFPIHTIFPMGVIGYSDAEGLLNKKEILLREGIKKVTSYQTSPEFAGTFTLKSVYVNKEGNIDSVIVCFPKSTKGDSGFCSTQYYLYDHSGRLIESRLYDTKKMASQTLSEYIDQNEIKTTTIDLVNSHTFTEYKYFNQKGQFVKSKQIINRAESPNTFLYYNINGLLDSIKYENSAMATNIFKRTEKRKSKIIEMETAIASFKWTYNSSDKCISASIATKNKLYSATGPGNKYSSKLEVHYYYNSDGTLSKVTEKTDGMRLHSMIYSYSKW